MFLKADLHLHTYYSNSACVKIWGRFGKYLIDSRSTPEDVLIKAKAKGLDVVAITDHDTIEGSLKASTVAKHYDLIAIPGVEIDSGEGHILAYGIEKDVERKMGIKKTVQHIHKLGGLAVAAHPFSPQGVFYSKRLVKSNYVWNFDGIEVFSALYGHACTKSIAYANHFSVPMYACTDSKLLSTIGFVYTEIEVENRSANSVIEAMKIGNTFPVAVNKYNRFIHASHYVFTNYFTKRNKLQSVQVQ